MDIDNFNRNFSFLSVHKNNFVFSPIGNTMFNQSPEEDPVMYFVFGK